MSFNSKTRQSMMFDNRGLLQIPERSRFYDLEPIGIGTADVESFSGYISRLAQEHMVSPLVLIKNSVRKIDLLPKVFIQNSLPAKIVSNLNGFSETSEKLVEIFQKATFRDDIQNTTFGIWKNKISTHGLMRKQLAWCQYCFQEQLETESPVYEKLIWTIEIVKVCLIHRTDLLEICPYCQSILKVLSGKSRSGFCSKCLRWLGSESNLRVVTADSRELWIAQNTSNFLSIKSQIHNCFSTNLEKLIQRTADGNINDFAHLTGVWHLAIRRLLKGEVLPTFGMLVAICYPLNFSPINLFIEKTESDDNSKSSLRKKKYTKTEFGSKLPVYLTENPPPSANEVARRIGWQTTRFQRNFPDEYQTVVERYLQSQADKLPPYTDEKIEEILRIAVTEIPPPSLQRVFRKIGCRNTGYRYYQRFHALCKQISLRYKNANKKSFDIDEAERVLKTALKEKPTPSFSEVARRLKCSRDNLNKKLPKLSSRLHKKYKSESKKLREQNQKTMYEEIIRVINELQIQQKPVTENAVRKLLTKKWNEKNFKIAYKEIRENRGSFG